MIKTAVILTLISFALPVQAMVYLWKDAAGVAHYTNREYEVPERYKAKVRRIYPEATDVTPPPAANGAPFSPVMVPQAVPVVQQTVPVVPQQAPIVKGSPPVVATPPSVPSEVPRPKKRPKPPRERTPEEEEDHNNI